MSMLWLKLYLIFVYNPFFSSCLQIDNKISFNYNNTYKYNVPYTVQVNNFTEFIMEFGGDLQTYDTPARVTVASKQANKSYPLFVTARQQKGVFSWQLPMLVQTPDSVEQFNNISRTLCPHNNLFSKLEETCDVTTQNIPVVHLTSSSPQSIDVTIVVETVEDFYIPLNRDTNVTSTPSQPKYYFYPFNNGHKLPDLMALSEQRRSLCQSGPGKEKNRLLEANLGAHYGWMSRPKSVIVMIESNDDLCAVVSIQNFTCPVFDNERDILYDGYYLTMTRRGGITLTQETFPLGFYIVFIVKSSDEDCVGKNRNSSLPTKVYYPEWGKPKIVDVVTNDGRMKQFSFRIIETISYQEYVIAAGAILGFFLSFYVAFLIAVIVQRIKMQNSPPVNAQEEAGLTVPTIPYDNMNVTSTRRRRIPNVEGSGESSSQHSPGEGNIGNGNPGFNYSSSSDTESEHSEGMDAAKEHMMVNKLCLANLARCRPRVLSARSKMYLWNVFTVAVFYTLPVIQLVVTYQRMLNQSGNQDLCYFNFLCAHPLMVLSDFNHVYSNLGYVMLGILFLFQVWRRHNRHRSRNQVESEVGIPQHFGLLYAMGIALVSEGLLSAAYHVCPNSMNFQFDTSFMYVTSVLCMVKIYQSRHPDINARAHATFCVLALIIFIGLVGVLNANYYFWILFTVLHLVTCLVMTFQIYYLGRFRLDGGIVYRAARELVTRPLVAITPTHCGRCILLLIANLANWIIAAYGMSQQSRDFASHLLLVLMSNLFLYTMFYIVMKLLHRESIRWYSWVFIALTYGTWFGSSYFYLDLSTDWSLTPAQSRQSNRVCSLLQLYDSHDIWHFLSSSAMFFSFNMYLTIDDNLSNVPREQIKVF